MGKTPYFDLSDFFDPEDFARRLRTHFWERVLKRGIPEKKNEEKILKSCRRKKSIFPRPTPYFWPITILLVNKLPTRIGLVLSNYKMDPHEI